MVDEIGNIAKKIDHALLHPTLTDEQIVNGCELAKAYRVAAVCVKPYSVAQAVEVLKDSNVSVCTVVGFPHGNISIEMKLVEAEDSIKEGATEIDVVVNVGKVMGGDWVYVEREIFEVNKLVVGKGAILKVIFETDYLDDVQVIKLCEISSRIGVAYVKTSTGFGFVKQEGGSYNYKGATDHFLRLMREHCPESISIKASGGIKTGADALRVIGLGVGRIGTSSTKGILDEC